MPSRSQCFAALRIARRHGYRRLLPIYGADTIEVEFSGGTKLYLGDDLDVGELARVQAVLNHRRSRCRRAPGFIWHADGPTCAEASTVRRHRSSPHDGALFIFRGKRGDLSKRSVARLFTKRLERGRFVWPVTKSGLVQLSATALSMLLEGIGCRTIDRSWQPEVPARG